ncbi:transforming acidic coiled-coil-containing protein 3 isoform X1 [Cricetulus griseus]|uniref:Transforming acidic coiled-coil-containing protein 3 n=1 Tax=Cricetulus griseus TaxID=10029 RepID=G3HK78_CRIGR|nr:transforming acidic coiled-coil-containing protein 3 isoform X1 [Cricetulus griseus]XP_027293569.1 transforming acidic coiled-coil-containing protein 3 isoform X1 [Cricetulus griseus]EGW00399.1 Transforming acidic coiled-coil-containing protein 3 [Cricetulus griseus]
MSLHILNEENVPSEKSSENSNFLFSQLELTGRSSVLRPSQKENIPPKNQAKAAKVTFHTPLRDPQTHRILSPNMTSKLETPFALDDNIGLENNHCVCLQKENQLPLAPMDDTPVVQIAAEILRAEGEVQEVVLNSSSTSASTSFLDNVPVAPPVGPVLEPAHQGPEPIMDGDLPPPIGPVLEPSHQGPEPIMDGDLAPPVGPVLEPAHQGPVPVMDGDLAPPVGPVLEPAHQGPEPMMDGDLAPLSEPVLEPAHQGPGPILDLEKENFRDPAEVLGTCAEVDYLEQFGTSSFKESAWRKQSLYLKFDPLLKESPLRPMPVVPVTNSIQDADEAGLGNPMEAKLVDLDFLGTLDDPVSGPPLCVLEPRGLLPAEPIVDILQYGQKDLDALVNATKQENLELRSKYEDLNTKYLEMGKIVDGFEKIAYKSMEEAEKQKELAEDKIKKVLKERDQLTADLNSMEKSFSDLFKRFEKQKEVIEGYRKNEDSLKKCVEEYIVKIEKEGQRYQALKAHAEEKLKLANEEIAQVRSKAQAEALALQASLRKAQMQIHSLEKTVEHKTKEIDELTRICDDLISKVEKI